jgi:hypothetical protein
MLSKERADSFSYGCDDINYKVVFHAKYASKIMCQIPLPIRCQPRFGAQISAVGRLSQILPKLLNNNRFLTLSGDFWGLKGVFSLI